MKQIIEAIAAQLPSYAAIAREIVDARLVEFESRVLERFSDPHAARRDAFKDPDFQFLLGRAQQAYSRSGDETVRETLVDLIAQRSKQQDRNRLALSLNEAVDRAAVMTSNEFAELSLTYLLKYTQQNKMPNLGAFINFLNVQACPLVADISMEESSYAYLESHSCVSISVMRTDLLGIWKEQYGGLFTKGWNESELISLLPDGKKEIFKGTNLAIPCVNDSTKLQLNALNKDVLHAEAAKAGVDLSTTELDNLWNALQSTMWSKDEMIEKLSTSEMVPVFGTVWRLG